MSYWDVTIYNLVRFKISSHNLRGKDLIGKLLLPCPAYVTFHHCCFLLFLSRLDIHSHCKSKKKLWPTPRTPPSPPLCQTYRQAFGCPTASLERQTQTSHSDIILQNFFTTALPQDEQEVLETKATHLRWKDVPVKVSGCDVDRTGQNRVGMWGDSRRGGVRGRSVWVQEGL